MNETQEDEQKTCPRCKIDFTRFSQLVCIIFWTISLSVVIFPDTLDPLYEYLVCGFPLDEPIVSS